MSGPATLHMSSADAAWLRMGGPANPMVISALVRFEDSLDAKRLAEVLQGRLVDVYPKFAMVIHPGRLPLVGSLPAIGPLPAVGPAWRRDSRFAIGRHLHLRALPRPGGEDGLRRLVGDLVSSPLPDDRPPWQAYLIECDGENTALLVRMHHCIADGIALAKVLLSLTDEPGDEGASRAGLGGPGRGGPEPASSPSRRSEGIAHAISGVARGGADVLLHPRRGLDLARGGARDVEVLAKLLAHPADPTGALKGRLSGTRRVGWSRALELELIKEIAHRNGATVNDVLLASVAGAIRRQLSGEPAASRRMTAIVPVNLRPAQEPVPRELGNRFGLVFLELPVGEGDRRRRLALVKRRMDEIKRSPEGPVSYAILQGMGAAPTELESRFVEYFSSKGSAVITNVPGPRAPRALAGARVRDLAIWAPASGSVGISMSLFSYRGMVTVGLLSDTAVLEQPQTVAERIAGEIEALARLGRSAA